MPIGLLRTAMILAMGASLGGCIISSEKSSAGNPVAPVSSSVSSGVERSEAGSNVTRLECLRDQVVTGVEVTHENDGEISQVQVICAPLRVQRKPG